GARDSGIDPSRAVAEALAIPASIQAERLRDAGWRVEADCAGGSLKSQLKRADRSGARLALLIGDNEQARGMVTIKDLRRDAPQIEVAQSDVINVVKQKIAST
ncbi:MAG TPA: His/Gly/Thr/Pro-type tRNA ligase C-terminal domain-containing protein, partial [Burkholderiales bacterium]|nr:His/Gly/Thr/Pro-type tRNA ligase C-terminal domain-containing protein [Burkholderiales bacterium]